MSGRPFTLAPFPGGPALPYQISGTASRQGARLTLAYALTGELAGVDWPGQDAAPQRQDNLWQATCCECFVALPREIGYWEANLSPAGHWQLYRFDGYREGMRPEAAVQAVAISSAQTADDFQLTATLDLSPLLTPDQPLLLGLSAVVRSRDGVVRYWALAHAGERPDFHQRAAFCLAL